MDWVKFKDKASSAVKKYRFVILILVIGLVLMLIPSKQDTAAVETQVQTIDEREDLSAVLEQVLSKMEGVGRVEVMLTIASGEKTIYQYDQDISGGELGNLRSETVLITDSNRGESGLVQQIIPAVYQGAIIVCQGAGNMSVRLDIVDAVSKVTGLGTDRISVLKMK